MPGRKDFVTVLENGRKVKVQKKIMLSTFVEAFRTFQEDHPDEKIGKSTFAALRPPNVEKKIVSFYRCSAGNDKDDRVNDSVIDSSVGEETEYEQEKPDNGEHSSEKMENFLANFRTITNCVARHQAMGIVSSGQ